MTTKTKTISTDVDVEIGLDDFTDEEIQKEYEDRFGDPDSDLEKIWLAMRQDAVGKAYDLMREYLRDKLGKVI